MYKRAIILCLRAVAWIENELRCGPFYMTDLSLASTMLPRQIKAIILNSGLYEGGMARTNDFTTYFGSNIWTNISHDSRAHPGLNMIWATISGHWAGPKFLLLFYYKHKCIGLRLMHALLFDHRTWSNIFWLHFYINNNYNNSSSVLRGEGGGISPKWYYLGQPNLCLARSSPH